MGVTVIAIDCGKCSVKVVVLRNGIVVYRGVFPSAIGNPDDGSTDMLENLHTFTCEEFDESNKRFLVGSIELPIVPDDSSSKDSLINRVLTIYAIASQVKPDEKVNIVIGCPVSIYKDKTVRTTYLENIVSPGDYKCTIDGKNVGFTVDKRLVCAESTGLITMHPEYFKKYSDVAVIDIGGLNMNISAIHNENIVVSQSHSSRHGGRMLNRTIQRMLMDNDIDISDEQVLCAIQKGYVNYRDAKLKDTSKSIIGNAIESFVDEIEKTLKNSWPNINTLDLFFTGGTSYLLKDYLLERFDGQAHFENCYEASIYSNAEGFTRKMYQMLQK